MAYKRHPYAAITRQLAAVALLAGLTCGQPLNCRQLAHVDKFPGAGAPINNYAGCWGMIGGDGREYALVAARLGTIIYDCHDPARPFEVAFIPGPPPSFGIYFWREIRDVDGYVYVSSEHGPVQVIDMRVPSSPSLVGTFGMTAHAIAADTQRKHLWLLGGPGNGAVVYDLNVSRTNPPVLTQYTENYVHDVFIQNGWAYLSLSNIGKLGILDISNIRAMTMRSLTPTPGALTHSSWADDTDGLCVTTDESSGGGLSVYDVSNKSAPTLLSTWFSPTVPAATLHHQYVVNKIVHMSAYSDGYWAVDISVPTNPRPVAHFDTSPLTGGYYVGAWGCYPLQPSGVVYISDTQTGFWILRAEHGVPRLYGSGSPGKGGFVPRMEFAGGFPRLGNPTFMLGSTAVLGGAPAALLVGSASTSLRIAGIDLLVDVTQPVVSLPAVASGSLGMAGAGTVALPLPIANQPGFAGLPMVGQWVVADASSPGGLLAASRGIAFSISP